ncbi:hypothetical protein UFOVP783_55 [uncultured Caudovirales phage]|uniref:Uncharacterized protein n=1 Tax=uncultured Caudovirales phage TaxID=2100421 RepID=A0A6J5NU81_9CAUD|nr:hypothetical protein UFOVP783_55 [uncultured Caudovirales phage]
MRSSKLPYEILIRYNNSGKYQGAHTQFREVFLDDAGELISERLLPAVPFGLDPDFPSSDLLGKIASDALASASSMATEVRVAKEQQSAAENIAKEAQTERDSARLEAQTAAATITQLRDALNTLQHPPAPTRPPGKWWAHAVELLSEFSSAELQTIHTCAIPDVTKLLLTLLAWPGEIWSADQRIVDGLTALEVLGILTPERRAEILAETNP